MIRYEIRTLTSQYRDGSLMYPGRRLFTWARVSPHLPWQLVSIEVMPTDGEVA